MYNYTIIESHNKYYLIHNLELDILIIENVHKQKVRCEMLEKIRDKYIHSISECSHFVIFKLIPTSISDLRVSQLRK